MTQKLSPVSATERASSAGDITKKAELAKSGMISKAHAMGASAVVNMSVSVVQTQPHGYQITAAGEGVAVAADKAEPPKFEAKF